MEIVRTLFDLLPPGFVAEPKVYHPAPFEVDVSTSELDQTEKLVGAGATQRTSEGPVTIPARSASKGRPDAESTPPSAIYAVTLRSRKPLRQKSELDVWYFPLAIGQTLPTIPLWLGPNLHIQLPLEPSYQEVCRLLRIP
jgi:hypothetical protein